MLYPAARLCLMAGSPSSVAGILIIRLGRSTRFQNASTISIVDLVSCAS